MTSARASQRTNWSASKGVTTGVYIPSKRKIGVMSLSSGCGAGQRAERQVEAVGHHEKLDLSARQAPVLVSQLTGPPLVTGLDGGDDLVMLSAGRVEVPGHVVRLGPVEGRAD